MQFCPRCRTYKEAWLFQAPVSICMACYGSSQGNEGLSLIQLKQKAIKSYKANRRKNLERRDIMIQSWTPYKDLMPKAGFSPSHKPNQVSLDQAKEIGDKIAADDDRWKECFYCKEEYPIEELKERPGPGPKVQLEMVLYCLGCAAEGFKIKNN